MLAAFALLNETFVQLSAVSLFVIFLAQLLKFEFLLVGALLLTHFLDAPSLIASAVAESSTGALHQDWQ